MNTQSPEYLIIGHITRDNTPAGPILGGTCAYSALTAHRLGRRVAIITSAGPDIPALEMLAGIEQHTVAAPVSTTFENIYEGGNRRQKWLASAQALSLTDVPPAWRQSPVVHLAPLVQEISPALCGQFPNSLVGVTMQGWLRGRDAAMNVLYQPHPDLDRWLPAIDVLVLSLGDLFGNRDAMLYLLNRVKLGVETLGPQGCTIYHQGQITHVPVQPMTEIDPTGAGDIFASAFFIKYQQTGNFISAAQFANACASLSVMQIGLNGVPTQHQVQEQVNRLYSTPTNLPAN